MKRGLLATTIIGGLSGIVLAGAPAVSWAEDATPATPPAKPAKPATSNGTNVGELVVTGSRIRHTTFTAPAPISVITTTEAKDEGLLTAAQMLQKSTAAAGSVQINEQFGGYIVNGGPGVDTVSLRGLGDVRTLVLLNGRRLNPAGVGGTVAAVDLNVIPENMIERYEILKDGASSIYGSDAIGGVVNIITKTNTHGLEIEADGYIPDNKGAAGQAWVVSVDGGIVKDKWRLMFGVEHDNQTAITQGDLPGGQCPLELQKLPTGTEYNFGRSYADGSPYCSFTQTQFVGDLSSGLTFVYDPNTPYPFLGPYNVLTQDSFGHNPRHTNIATNPGDKGVDALSASRRTSGYLNGSVDLTPTMDLYFEGLLTNRTASVHYTQDFFPADFGHLLDATFSPFNPLTPGFGLDLYQPVLVTPLNLQSVDVTAGRALIGLKGDLFKVPDWKFDLGFTYGENSGDLTQHPQLTSKVDNALDVVQVSPGFNGPKRVSPVDGLTYTCAINITNPNERCYPINWFESQQDFNGDPAYNYITGTDVQHTDYKQFVVDGHIDGPLFNLPAGQVQGVLGGEFRHDSLDNVPGPEALAQNYFNFTTEGITKGSESVTEAYGEVEVPLLKGVPLFESLTFNGSARFTHHSLAGDHWTFKASGNWELTSWFRIRSTYGTSFRGPELFENFLASQVGFTSATDPCTRYGTNADPSSALYKNCASEGVPLNWAGYSATPADITEGAQGRLKPETSKNFTIGGIFQPSFADLQVTLDYYHIVINNEITTLGASNILNLCYESPNFRSGSPYCTLVSPRDPSGNIAQIDDRYINVAEEKTSGLDLEVLYRKDVGLGRISLHGEATYQLSHTQTLFPGSDPLELLGSFGYPNMVFNTDARFKHGNWEFTWATTFLGHQQEYTMSGIAPGGRYKLHQEAQWYHTLSVSYSGDKWRAEIGVRNIADKYPPTISNNPAPLYAPRIAEFANGYGNLELFGRTWFFNLKKQF
jgi:iron complex outermembrane receptor protein